MSRAVDAFPPPPSSPPPPDSNRGAAHRIVEVAFCCAPLSRAVDAFSLLSAVQDSSWMQSFIVHQQAENNAARITLFSVEMLPTTEEEYSLMSPTGSTTDQLNPHVRLRYPSQKLRNPRYQRARRGDCVSKLSPAEADRIPCSFSPCVWSPASHRLFPAACRRLVRLLLLVRLRGGGGLGALSGELLCGGVFPFLICRAAVA